VRLADVTGVSFSVAFAEGLECDLLSKPLRVAEASGAQIGVAGGRSEIMRDTGESKDLDGAGRNVSPARASRASARSLASEGVSEAP
jgi:hypothetical protein